MMFEHFEDDARRAFLGALTEAERFRHLRVETSHLLLSLMAEDGSEPVRLLAENDVTPERVLLRFFDKPAAPPWRPPAHIPFDQDEYRAVMDASREEADGAGRQSVSSLNVLAGLVRQPHGSAATLIRSLDVDTGRLLAAVRRRAAA